MKIHELKTDPDPFRKVWEGDKKFELRFNDRGFDAGDLLVLKETNISYAMQERAKRENDKLMPEMQFTGRSIVCRTNCVFFGPHYGIQEGWVCMSLEVLDRHEICLATSLVS